VDVQIAVGGAVVGLIVGLTGMGGGALMTPMLVFLFGVDTFTAISSDIVASLFMKPTAAAVHLRRGTVNMELVRWLCVGSVPAAFAGAWLIHLLPSATAVDAALRTLLGVALLVACAGIFLRSYVQMTRFHLPLGEGPATVNAPPEIPVHPMRTVVLGALAGLMVGLTSVGAGSIVIVSLLLLYPTLKASVLVGTDIVQAIPLVGAAALGHVLFGSLSLPLTVTLLVGAVPGAWLGAQLSSRAPGGLIRRIIALVLLASGLRLVGLPIEVAFAAVIVALGLGVALWAIERTRGQAAPSRSDA
jgi:uncharacterized membrane protein YfcA